MQNLATVTIDLPSLRHNMETVKTLAPQSAVVAMLKANAYGHGIIEVANALTKADAFAVARIDEAIQLREAGIHHRLILLSGIQSANDLLLCSDLGLDIVVHDASAISYFDREELPRKVNVWVKIDSGMHRLGIPPQDSQSIIQSMLSSSQVGEVTLMTHLSSAEDDDVTTTHHQLQVFEKVCNGHPLKQSLANSAAIMQHPNTHKSWVRPGIMLYGANPLYQNKTPIVDKLGGIHALKAAMTFSAKVLSIRKITAGESVGYNGRWTASCDSVIATISVGYGDGYPRHAPNGTPVLINGKRASLVGAVSMDLITIDVTQCPLTQPGDDVILWGIDQGGNELKVEEIASLAKTISYELFTSISDRVERIYR